MQLSVAITCAEDSTIAWSRHRAARSRCGAHPYPLVPPEDYGAVDDAGGHHDRSDHQEGRT